MTAAVGPVFSWAVLGLALSAAALAARAEAAPADDAAWLREAFPRATAPAHPATIAISGCYLTVTQRPDRKTDVTTQIDLRQAQITRYAGPGSAHVDFLTAGVFPVRFRFADGSTSTGATAAAVLGIRRGDQAIRIAAAFDRLRASCASGTSR